MTERDGPGITPPRRIVVSGGSDAREAVCETLIERYAYFINEERALRAENRVAEAEGAHFYATLVIRAYAAESRL